MATQIHYFKNIHLPFLLMCLLALSLAPSSASASVASGSGNSVHIINQGDTVHLEFEGQTQWDYDIKKVDKKGKSSVEILISPLSEKGLQELKTFSSPLVSSIEINKQGPDGKTMLTFHLSTANVEPFDYLTEKPSRLIVDFFKNQSSAKNDLKKESSKESLPNAEAEASEKSKTKVQSKLPAKKQNQKVSLANKKESQRNRRASDARRIQSWFSS